MDKNTETTSRALAELASSVAQSTDADCCMVMIGKKKDTGKIHWGTFMGGEKEKLNGKDAAEYIKSAANGLLEMDQGIEEGKVGVGDGDIYGKTPGDDEPKNLTKKQDDVWGGFAE